jgi:hypothetical protein
MAVVVADPAVSAALARLMEHKKAAVIAKLVCRMVLVCLLMVVSRLRASLRLYGWQTLQPRLADCIAEPAETHLNGVDLENAGVKRLE